MSIIAGNLLMFTCASTYDVDLLMCRQSTDVDLQASLAQHTLHKQVLQLVHVVMHRALCQQPTVFNMSLQIYKISNIWQNKAQQKTKTRSR